MAEIKKYGDITVNDGKGLLDNDGMIDAIIVKLNSSVQLLFNGKYIPFCGCINELGQMLVTLKKGISNETSKLKSNIESLKSLNHELNVEICKIKGLELEDEFTKKDGAE